MSNSWEYRVIIKQDPNGEESCHIHEIYYDENERVIAWSSNSITPMGENGSELKKDLETMRKACSLPSIAESDLETGLKREETLQGYGAGTPEQKD